MKFLILFKKQKSGAKVVLSTGRPLPGVTPLLDELNLNDDGDYVICFNGAVVQEVKSKRFYLILKCAMMILY